MLPAVYYSEYHSIVIQKLYIPLGLPNATSFNRSNSDIIAKFNKKNVKYTQKKDHLKSEYIKVTGLYTR